MKRQNSSPFFERSCKKAAIETPSNTQYFVSYPTPSTRASFSQSLSPLQTQLSSRSSLSIHPVSPNGIDSLIKSKRINVLRSRERHVPLVKIKHKKLMDMQLRNSFIDEMKWIQEYHYYQIETLYAAVNYMDRVFESRKTCPRQQSLYRIPLVCLFIAAKIYEESEEPTAAEFEFAVKMKSRKRDLKDVHNSIDQNQIKDLERRILCDLKFEVSIITPHSFLAEFLLLFPQILDKKKTIRIMDKCDTILFTAMKHSEFLIYQPSIIACAILMVLYNRNEPLVSSLPITNDLFISIFDFDEEDCIKFENCISNIVTHHKH